MKILVGSGFKMKVQTIEYVDYNIKIGHDAEKMVLEVNKLATLLFTINYLWVCHLEDKVQ